MEHDFLIIGGGIAGVSAAARLAPLGRVILLESEGNLAYHASGRSAALYAPHYGNAAVVGLSQASGAYFDASGTLTPRGTMFVDGPEHRARFEALVQDIELEVLSLEQARAIVPILNPETVAHVGLTRESWDIDTDLLIQNFAREARTLGARIVTSAPVTQIARRPTGWTVMAGGHPYDARIIVNAAGAWADQIATLAGVAPVGLQPYRRSMARLPAPGGHDVSGWPMILGGDEEWYMKPDAGAVIVSPADADPMAPHDAFADDMVLAEGLARYEAMVTEPVTRMLANWAGLRTFAPDRTPVIGHDPDVPGFFWLAGQGGYGFQSAPAACQLVADLMAGRPPALDPEIVAALSPARLR